MKIENKTHKRVLLAGTPEYENLTAELYYKDNLISIVWHEGDNF